TRSGADPCPGADGGGARLQGFPRPGSRHARAVRGHRRMEELSMAFKLTLDGVTHDVTIRRRRPNLVLSINGKEHEVATVTAPGDGRHDAEIDGRRLTVVRSAIVDRQIIRL